MDVFIALLVGGAAGIVVSAVCAFLVLRKLPNNIGLWR